MRMPISSCASRRPYHPQLRKPRAGKRFLHYSRLAMQNYWYGGVLTEIPIPKRVEMGNIEAPKKDPIESVRKSQAMIVFPLVSNWLRPSPCLF